MATYRPPLDPDWVSFLSIARTVSPPRPPRVLDCLVDFVFRRLRGAAEESESELSVAESSLSLWRLRDSRPVERPFDLPPDTMARESCSSTATRVDSVSVRRLLSDVSIASMKSLTKRFDWSPSR